jgi:hypothetical protein
MFTSAKRSTNLATAKPMQAPSSTSLDTSKLLGPTSKLFEALEVFQIATKLVPDKDHYGAHVKLLDYKFNKKHLVDRLRGSIVDWVFCKAEARRIFNEELGSNEDYSAASFALYNAARETFRPHAPQGQFGELLLSAFLQHIFEAVPLLRKQVVRTSDAHERFGADAIHFSNKNGNHLYLGESKCYKSKYKFPEAFATSLESINTTLENFTSEIKRFRTGNFIEADLYDVASRILRNDLSDLEIHPVSILIYNESTKLSGAQSTVIKEEIRKAIQAQCKKIKSTAYQNIQEADLNRLTYIIMPVWELDKLLEEFESAL